MVTLKAKKYDCEIVEVKNGKNVRCSVNGELFDETYDVTIEHGFFNVRSYLFASSITF